MSWGEIKKALNSTLGTEQFQPLDVLIRNIVAPERENKYVYDLDFSDGYQTIYPSSASKTMESVTLYKPSGLEPQNIRNGVEVAGITGTYGSAQSVVAYVNVSDLEEFSDYQYIICTEQDPLFAPFSSGLIIHDASGTNSYGEYMVEVTNGDALYIIVPDGWACSGGNVGSPSPITFMGYSYKVYPFSPDRYSNRVDVTYE